MKRMKSDFLDSVMWYYHKGRDNSPAPISQLTAVALTALFTILYVAPFYIWPSLRTSILVSRNAPSTVRARTRSVVLTSTISFLITVGVLVFWGHATILEVLSVLGLCPVDVLDIAKCLLLVAVLFAGPLFEEAIIEGNWVHWVRPTALKEALFDSWVGYRNLVVGPVSEELVFRAFVIPFFLMAQARPAEIVFKTPLIFGLAHLHHLHEFIISHQGSSNYAAALMTPRIIVPGLIRSIFQFTYTSLFGFFVAFVFLRTGNIYACIVAHTFCNWMGLPRFWGRVGRTLEHEAANAVQGKGSKLSADKVGKAHDTLAAGPRNQALGVEWTVAYYVSLFLGAFGFYKLLWPLTESGHALAEL